MEHRKLSLLIKVLLLPITIPALILLIIWQLICDIAEGTWRRIELISKREW